MQARIACWWAVLPAPAPACHAWSSARRSDVGTSRRCLAHIRRSSGTWAGQPDRAAVGVAHLAAPHAARRAGAGWGVGAGSTRRMPSSFGQHPHTGVRSKARRPWRHSWSARGPINPASIGQPPPAWRWPARYWAGNGLSMVSLRLWSTGCGARLSVCRWWVERARPRFTGRRHPGTRASAGSIGGCISSRRGRRTPTADRGRTARSRRRSGLRPGRRGRGCRAAAPPFAGW
jgi:hypothetical protein